jgi:hypothetical protein
VRALCTDLRPPLGAPAARSYRYANAAAKPGRCSASSSECADATSSSWPLRTVSTEVPSRLAKVAEHLPLIERLAGAQLDETQRLRKDGSGVVAQRLLDHRLLVPPEGGGDHLLPCDPPPSRAETLGSHRRQPSAALDTTFVDAHVNPS